VRAAAAVVGELSAEPRGTLRLLVAPAAEAFLGGELLARFLGAHSEVRLDLFVSDERE
jgi:DNA-binding transcriptional LysR family regulator